MGSAPPPAAEIRPAIRAAAGRPATRAPAERAPATRGQAETRSARAETRAAPAQTSESVLTRGKNAQRTAHFIEAPLTIAAVGSPKFGPDATFNAAAKFT